MSKRFAWAVALILIALPVLGMTTSRDAVLKAGDHKKLGSKIADWIEARVAKEGTDDARSEFEKELGKWAKKGGIKGNNPLAFPDDLGQALWYSYAYDKAAKKAVKGKVKDVDVPYRGREIGLTIRAPQKYNAKSTYPLLLMIGEHGKKPFDYLTEDWVLGDLKDNAILCVVHMPKNVKSWTLIKTEDGKPGGIANILTTFGAVQANYAIDFDKVFLVGRMQGVQAAMETASQFPDRFAGVIGRTGDFKDVEVDNFQNTATFFAGGGEGATKFKEAAEAAEYANCTVAPAAKEEDIWHWVQETTRNANPTEVTLRPGVPFPNSAYWLRMPAWDGEGEARLHGKINREENTIIIEGRGMASVTVSFNDTMVDLSQPVKVICNGVETVDLIPRSVETVLNNIFDARIDPGKVYVASKRYGIVDPGTEEESEDGK